MSARIGPGGGTEVGRGSLRAALWHRALQLQNSRSCGGPEAQFPALRGTSQPRVWKRSPSPRSSVPVRDDPVPPPQRCTASRTDARRRAVRGRPAAGGSRRPRVPLPIPGDVRGRARGCAPRG